MPPIRFRFFAALTAVLIAAWPAAAQTIAITGGRVLTVSHGVIENGTVLVENGKIAAVGRDIKVPRGAQVVDARDKVVMPGMFDAGDKLGTVEIPAVRITVDNTEYTDPLQPQLRVLDALNPESENILVTRAAGVTNALSTPADGNLVGGQSAVIQLDGGTVDELVVKSPAALHISLGEESKLTYGEKNRAPETRMGEMAMLRQEFLKAQHYKQVQDAYGQKQGGKQAAPPARDLKLDAMMAALEGRIPVVAHAERVSDIENALRLADEFHFRLILAGGAAAWRVADQLAARKIPVIVGPILQEPTALESMDARLDNAARLYKAGVPIAIQTTGDNEVRNLPFEVEYAISYGLPEDAAVAAVTLNPARLFGVDDRLGSIDEGKDANLIVLDGTPFRVKTHVVTVLIGGKVLDLSNHQTKLYEFYKKKYGIQ